MWRKEALTYATPLIACATGLHRAKGWTQEQRPDTLDFALRKRRSESLHYLVAATISIYRNVRNANFRLDNNLLDPANRAHWQGPLR